MKNLIGKVVVALVVLRIARARQCSRRAYTCQCMGRHG